MQTLCPRCHSEPGAWHLPPSLPTALEHEYMSAQPVQRRSQQVRAMFLKRTGSLRGGVNASMRSMPCGSQPALPTTCLWGVLERCRSSAVIPEAVDTDVFTPQAQPRTLLPARHCPAGTLPGSKPSCPYRFLFVGKWERRKGLDVLLRAFLSEIPRAVGRSHLLSSSF